MAVLEPQFTASGALEVVLATEDGNVLGQYSNQISGYITGRGFFDVGEAGGGVLRGEGGGRAGL